jgi:protein involved in plasmid replication-relaxation
VSVPERAPQKRKPRFRRVRTRHFELTARDLEIIRAVHKYRLLTSEHIVTLLGSGSKQNILRRLGLLFHHRYLDRPLIQIADFQNTLRGSPMVYALGNKGSELVAEGLGLPARSIDWTAKNRSLRPTFYRHTLMVSGVMVAFEAACRRHGTVRVIPWEEILETKCPPETRKKAKPQTWRVRISGKGAVGVTPDRIFGLHFLERPEGANRTYFFLEADRGSMPVVRRTFTQTAIYKKLLAYHATATGGLHTKLFGIQSFRVLTVTDSPERGRVKSMVAACQELRGLQGIFLFTDERSLLSGDTLSHEWMNGRGEIIRLVEDK